MYGHPECAARLHALRVAGRSPEGVICVKDRPDWRKEDWVSDEDAQARADAISFLDGNVPMALEKPGGESPLAAENPKPKRRRLTPEETLERDRLKAEDRERRAAERKAATQARRAERKEQRDREKAEAKAAALAEKVAAAEGGQVQLPAVVMRDGTVRHVSDADAWAVIGIYLDDLCLDCENSGYPLGHELYELRTVQVGGEEAAIVFDALDPAQMQVASLALALAGKIRAHSATADVIPVVEAGLIAWDAIWAKMQDSVLNAKLTDPKMSGSDADALKELAADLLREYAVSPAAEKAKNELFAAMGCLVKTEITTPPERNGWYRVNRFSVTMTRYAGSDVLDLAAVLRVLPPLPVDDSVMEREREFQASCAPVTWKGFQLDSPHVKMKIAEAEEARDEAQRNVLLLSDGKIVNPKSPDVIKLLPEVIPGLVLGVNRKTKRPSAARDSLEKLALDYLDRPLEFHLLKQILAYRQQDTKLGLLLRPLEALCDHGDGRGRPTVYTIEASTGRSSCRRFNGQQMSRQGGVRACIRAGKLWLSLDEGGQWWYADDGAGQLLDMAGISADFKGCEIFVAAGLSGDQALYEAEASPFCWKCERMTVTGDECSCGYKDNGELAGHTGLHWRTAHSAHSKSATKEHRYQAKRGTFCVPEAGTEILTRRGWLKHYEVREGDDTLGMGEDGKLHWTPVTAVHHFADRELTRLKSGNWEAVTTPEHRWVTDRRRDGGLRGRYRQRGFTETQDLQPEHRILLGAVADTPHELPVTTAEAALIAWAYTDGCVQDRDGRFSVSVKQAKLAGIAALEAVLAGLPHTVHEHEADREGHLPWKGYRLRSRYARDLWKRAGIEVADKAGDRFDLTSFVLKLGREARAAFLRAAIDAEGFVTPQGRYALSQNEGPVYEALLLTASLEGYHVRQYRRRFPEGNAVHVAMHLAQPRIGGTRLKRSPAGRGDTWCVTTGLGSWLMRQEGRVMLTGNCKLFGGGPETAAAQVYCQVADMEKMFRAFEADSPVFTAWDRQMRQAYKSGSVAWRDYSTGENHFAPIEGSNRMVYRAYSGRNIYIGNGEHAAGNGAIQGTAREVLVDGVLKWRRTRWGRLALLPIHDQILKFVPAHEARQATAELARCMETTVLSSPGFEVRIGADVDEPFDNWPDSS